MPRMHMPILLVYFPSHNRDTKEKAFFSFLATLALVYNDFDNYYRNGIIEPLCNDSFESVSVF